MKKTILLLSLIITTLFSYAQSGYCPGGDPNATPLVSNIILPGVVKYHDTNTFITTKHKLDSAIIAALDSILAGSNVTITRTPHGLIINATGGGGGGVSTFSSGNLSPLFTTSVSNPTTTPSLLFSLINQGADKFLRTGYTGSSQVPFYGNIYAKDVHGLSDSTATSFTLTTTGSSGAATYSGGVLNIPNYVGSGAGSPAGSNTDVQFNNSGSFGGSSALTFNGSSLQVNHAYSGIGQMYINSSDIPEFDYGINGVRKWATYVTGTNGRNFDVFSFESGQNILDLTYNGIATVTSVSNYPLNVVSNNVSGSIIKVMSTAYTSAQCPIGFWAQYNQGALFLAGLMSPTGGDVWGYAYPAGCTYVEGGSKEYMNIVNDSASAMNFLVNAVQYADSNIHNNGAVALKLDVSRGVVAPYTISTGDTNTARVGVVLDVKSKNNNQGSIPSPPMSTTQRLALTYLYVGLQVYDYTLDKLAIWNGSSWSLH